MWKAYKLSDSVVADASPLALFVSSFFFPLVDCETVSLVKSIKIKNQKITNVTGQMLVAYQDLCRPSVNG